MADLLAIAEGPKSQETMGLVTSLDQIDQKNFGEFLTKSSVWDFYDMRKGEYMLKDNNEKEKLIINFYNEMVKGMLVYFCASTFVSTCLQSKVFSGISLLLLSSIISLYSVSLSVDASSSVIVLSELEFESSSSELSCSFLFAQTNSFAK